jgi:glycosidase
MTPLSSQGEGGNSKNPAPNRFTEKKAMTRFKLLSAAAMLSLMFATPVFAQAAVQEPGLYAFYYPNNDVLNGGRPTPAAGLDARTLMQFNSSDAYGTPARQRHEAFER